MERTGFLDKSVQYANWRFISILRQMTPLLMILTLVGIVSGLILQHFEETLLDYPELLVLIPVMIGMGGNLGAVLGARISSAFHLGIMKFSFNDEVLRTNIIAVLLLSFAIFTMTGVFGWAFSLILGIGTEVGLLYMTIISLIAGIALSILMVFITLISSYLSYKIGLDPDNTVLPIVTSLCDLLGVAIFYSVIFLVLM